jgi:hypothetical protein
MSYRDRIRASVNEAKAPANPPNWVTQNKENVARDKRRKKAREAEAAAWLEQVKARKRP